MEQRTAWDGIEHLVRSQESFMPWILDIVPMASQQNKPTAMDKHDAAG